MTKRIKISELSEFDAAESLNNEEDMAAYLTAVLEENDPALLAAALGDIARARGMSQIAKDSGITREALYKAIRPGSEPRFETIIDVFVRPWVCAWWRSRCILYVDTLQSQDQSLRALPFTP